MKKLMHKIIFVGTPEFAVPALKALISNGLSPIAVITEPDRPAGRGKEIKLSVIKLLAKKYDIPVWQPEKLKAISYKLKALRPTVGIVVAYGQIIPQEILEIPKLGFINIHPSLLPKYRGPSPIQAAILNGDKETGVTIIKLDEKMDHGDEVATKKLKNIETKKLNYQQLSDKLAKLGAQLLLKTLNPYLSGKIKPKHQNHQEASYTKLIKKSDGLINWQQAPEIIERKIRAYNPWPGTFTFINGKRLKICQAHISCDKLVIDRVQLEGKKEISWSEFLRGWKKPLPWVNPEQSQERSSKMERWIDKIS